MRLLTRTDQRVPGSSTCQLGFINLEMEITSEEGPMRIGNSALQAP